MVFNKRLLFPQWFSSDSDTDLDIDEVELQIILNKCITSLFGEVSC